MKSSFDASSTPQEIIDFVTTTFSKSKNYQDALETIALSLLPLIKAAKASGNFDTNARNIPHLYDMIMDEADFDDWSEKLTGIPRQKILDTLKGTSIGQEQSHEDLLKRAGQIRSQILSMTEEDYIALSAATDSVLPPGLRAAMEAMEGVTDPVEAAKEMHRLAATLSDEEIAAVLVEREKKLKPEAVADGVYDLLQQCTPDRLRDFTGYMNDNLGGAGVGMLVKRFWEFTEEVLQAAEDGDFMKMRNPAKARSFGRTLNDTLAALEGGIQHAGLTMPERLSDYISEALNTRKVLRTAAAGKLGAQAGLPQGITVNRPLRLKKPGF